MKVMFMEDGILALAPFPVFNDKSAVTIEDLEDRLIDLKDQGNNIQARADAEARDLTEDEQAEIEQIFAAFEATEADIDRRRKLGQINSKMEAPKGRITDPDGGDPQATQHVTRAQMDHRPRNTVPAQPRSQDQGKWGFRSAGEFLAAVVKGSAKGGSIDPRLVANAPTTYGSEGVGADGGFAVPPDFRTAIVAKVMGEDSLLSRTDQMTTSSNSITVPKDETTPWQPTGGIQAFWESEGGQKPQSKPALGEITVKANKIVSLVPLTDELLEDAPAMAAYVNRKAPEKIDFKINDAIINGSGVGMPLGILNSPGTVTVSKVSGQDPDTLLFDNIISMWSRMPASARRNAVWLANSDVDGQLMRMAFPGTGTAVPTYLPPGGLSATPYASLMGRPVISTEAMPALGDRGDLILADLSQYMSVVKAGGVRQDVSIHLWFDYDITAFRFVMRVGGQPWWNAPIERNGGQPNRGFFVTLEARS